MTESAPHAPAHGHEDKRSLLRKLGEFLRPGPDSREELVTALTQAETRQVIDPQSRVMLEGVLDIADMTASDVMLPAHRIDMLDIASDYEDLLHQVIDAGHSRFPVFEGERDNIIGVLLAKDLLKLQRAPELNIRALLRAPVFVPESKGLNDLLRDFRIKRNHLAVVIDEFGRLAGLVTLEDVLEEIVGEIEDEFDEDEDVGNIFPLADGSYRVSGDAAITHIARHFEAPVAPSHPEDADEFDTIGGLIAHEMGHVPRKGELITLSGLHFQVLHTQGGAVRWFKVTPAHPTVPPPTADTAVRTS